MCQFPKAIHMRVLNNHLTGSCQRKSLFQPVKNVRMRNVLFIDKSITDQKLSIKVCLIQKNLVLKIQSVFIGTTFSWYKIQFN